MSRRKQAYQRLLGDVAAWSEHVLQFPLYRYQVEIAEEIKRQATLREGGVVVVEMPRQSGKNEVSAQIESMLLARNSMRGGSMVKTAPTWTPQIVNSKMRLTARLETAAERVPLQYRPSYGYIIRCGKAMIQFLSAKPNASVVGATASILLEVDESQDVDIETHDKNFSPMRASTGAAAVYWGTTWVDDTLLEVQKNALRERRVTGKYFRVPPERVAEENPAYGVFLDNEVRRLGRDHPLVKTQYFLEPITGRGRMLTDQHLRLMVGEHPRRMSRTDEQWIVAGLDFAGADEKAGLTMLEALSGRDSVALTIAEVHSVQIATGLFGVSVRYLDRYEWTNISPVSLHTALFEILQNRWNVDLLHCDATGIGESSTAFLATALGQERVNAIKFDSAWNTHSRLAFNTLMQVNGGLLQDYKPEGFDPMEVAKSKEPPVHDVSAHAWWQRGHARLSARPGSKVKADVLEEEGHDDMFVSEMLCVDAAVKLLGNDLNVAEVY